MSGIGNMAGLAMRAYNAYDFVSSLIDGDENSEKPGLWDALMAQAVKYASMGASNGEIMALAVAAATHVGNHKHHTIPQYMCGHKEQNLIVIDTASHAKLHAELYAFEISVRISGVAYDLIFRKKKKLEFASPIKRLGRTPMGRRAIAEGLHMFYELEGWGGVGNGDSKNVLSTIHRKATLMDVFQRERLRFTGNHYNSSCKGNRK